MDKLFALSGFHGYPPCGGSMLPRFLYSTVFYLLTPLICLRLLWRGRLVPGYRKRWVERFGVAPPMPDGREVIWVHAVSVGETIAAVPLIRLLQGAYPHLLVAVTTTTPTGSERVAAMLGDSVYHCYAPYDLPDAISRFLGRVRPRLLIVMETELWPNLIHGCHKRGIPVVLANARLSEKSARGYQRVRSLAVPMLEELAVVAAQHRDDGQRFRSLGLGEGQLRITGNIKFDLEISSHQQQCAKTLALAWREPGNRPLWLVASTHRGEDEIILAAFREILVRYPSTLLVLVPRHPDRFDQVAALCESLGFATVRRSAGQLPSAETRILLGDTMGELPVFFGACDIAFVGGSLVPVGGHNLLEPAAWGVPVLSGPHLFNFSEASALLLEAGGLQICGQPSAIAGAVIALLDSADLCHQQGMAARGVVEANRGAMGRLLGIIEQLLGQQSGPDLPRH